MSVQAAARLKRVVEKHRSGVGTRVNWQAAADELESDADSVRRNWFTQRDKVRRHQNSAKKRRVRDGEEAPPLCKPPLDHRVRWKPTTGADIDAETPTDYTELASTKRFALFALILSRL